MSVRLKLISFGLLSMVALISVAGLGQYHINQLSDTLDMYRSQAEEMQAYFHLSSEFSEISESYKDAIIAVMMGNEPEGSSDDTEKRIDSMVEAVNRRDSGQPDTGSDTDISEVLANLKPPPERRC